MLTAFDEKAQKAIVIAESIAFDLGHSSVGSEHLLLSLLKIKDCPFSKILKTYHVDDEMIYEDVVRLFGEKDIQPFYMEYSEVVKKILEDAMSMSEAKKESKVSLNTLSIAMLLQKESVAVVLLNNYHVPFDEIKKELEEKENMDDIKLGPCESFATILQPSRKKLILERNQEVKDIIISLSCKEKSNVALIGKAGVGKSAVVEELARILKYYPPKNLDGYQIVSFNLTAAMSGTRYRGELEEKINKLLNITRDKKAIIFIDEGHDILKSGATESLSVSDMIKPVMARSDYKFIVATTEAEYNQFIQNDAALNRRFRQVTIREPEINKVKRMITKKVEDYSKYHHVSIKDLDIDNIIDLCIDIPDRYFPDKALDVIDYVMAYCKFENKTGFDIQVAKRYINSLKGYPSVESEVLLA